MALLVTADGHVPLTVANRVVQGAAVEELVQADLDLRVLFLPASKH